MMSGRKEYKSYKELRDAFFTYTRAERNGIYVLAAILILVGAYKFVDRYYWMSGPSYTPPSKEVVLPNIEEEEKSQKIELFAFDPNTVSKEEMVRLGFKEKAIKTFMNYRSTGVRFNNVSDFERVYSIKREDIDRVGEYIQFPNNEKKALSKEEVSDKPVIKKRKPPPTLFDFDPNTALETELEKLGLSSKVVKTMLKFRRKGSFRKPNDVAKIYGLSDEQFEQLLPYIKIRPKEKVSYKPPNRGFNDTSTIASKKQYKPVYAKDTVAFKSIDINKATNEEWQRINGIGPTYAKMINRFRGKLGGFYSVDQIGETYGLPDSVFQKIVPYVQESSPPSKIPINLIIVDSLAKHPYLTWKQANVVINYRTHHGPYKNSRDVAKVKIFTKEKWERIIPYLDYSEVVDTLINEE